MTSDWTYLRFLVKSGDLLSLDVPLWLLVLGPPSFLAVLIREWKMYRSLASPFARATRFRIQGCQFLLGLTGVVGLLCTLVIFQERRLVFGSSGVDLLPHGLEMGLFLGPWFVSLFTALRGMYRLGLLLRCSKPIAQLDPGLRALIAAAANRTGVPLHRMVVWAPASGPPFPCVYAGVMGLWVLIYPQSIRRVCEVIEQPPAGTSAVLQSFLVGHELTHLANGECRAVVFWEETRPLLEQWAVLLVGVYLLNGFVAPLPSHHFLFVPVLLLSTSTVLITLLVRSLARQREFAADSGGLSCVPEVLQDTFAREGVLQHLLSRLAAVSRVEKPLSIGGWQVTPALGAVSLKSGARERVQGHWFTHCREYLASRLATHPSSASRARQLQVGPLHRSVVAARVASLIYSQFLITGALICAGMFCAQGLRYLHVEARVLTLAGNLTVSDGEGLILLAVLLGLVVLVVLVQNAALGEPILAPGTKNLGVLPLASASALSLIIFVILVPLLFTQGIHVERHGLTYFWKWLLLPAGITPLASVSLGLLFASIRLWMPPFWSERQPVLGIVGILLAFSGMAGIRLLNLLLHPGDSRHPAETALLSVVVFGLGLTSALLWMFPRTLFRENGSNP